MVLNGEDDRVGRGDKGRLSDGNDHLSEADLRCESVTVVDDWQPIVAVPAIELHTTTPGEEDLTIELNGGVTFQLVAGEVSVVGGGDVIVGEWARHRVLLHGTLPDCLIVAIHQEPCKSLKAKQVAPPELRVWFVLRHKLLGFVKAQLLALVVADEVEQGVSGQHQVLARVQAGRVVEDALHCSVVTRGSSRHGRGAFGNAEMRFELAFWTSEKRDLR